MNIRSKRMIEALRRVERDELAWAMAQPVRVTVRRVKRGSWNVYLYDDVLVEQSADPEFDAARALSARGIRGTMQTYQADCSHWSLRLDIEKAAGFMTSVNAEGRPVFRPHRTLVA